jgi:hypothetical protein
MTAEGPIPDLAARMEHTAQRPGTDAHLTAEEVQTALGILRSYVERAVDRTTDQLYRIESVAADGVTAELAVVTDPVIARVAYDAAENVVGGKLILRRGNEEIGLSAPSKTCAA